ncbi:uncharacterized protein CIMG_12757 [Coccidioides immitis RS]|uniref:Uncharacterized protein n=1 Tax=Coccidioides immitis (strain RS) TaxID=246410 RepID=A0A0D8JS66_COCIM|nr:uncharacterized protein CIMG_12757 [Coccidioides immitis RS]KJF60112.1 hypothetical protein CIMG_12757 [Coccidioides immitis RS]
MAVVWNTSSASIGILCIEMVGDIVISPMGPGIPTCRQQLKSPRGLATTVSSSLQNRWNGNWCRPAIRFRLPRLFTVSPSLPVECWPGKARVLTKRSSGPYEVYRLHPYLACSSCVMGLVMQRMYPDIQTKYPVNWLGARGPKKRQTL